MSSFWVPSETELSSSALEKVALEDSILLIYWFSSRPWCSRRHICCLEMCLFTAAGEGAISMGRVEARDFATLSTVCRTAPTQE